MSEQDIDVFWLGDLYFSMVSHLYFVTILAGQWCNGSSVGTVALTVVADHDLCDSSLAFLWVFGPSNLHQTNGGARME